jgi:hypothetical protein
VSARDVCIQIVLDLAAQGREAIASALQNRTISVRLPTATGSRTRVARRDPSERTYRTRKVFDPTLVKHVRDLRRGGMSYAKIETAVGLKPDKGRTSWMLVNYYEGPEA